MLERVPTIVRRITENVGARNVLGAENTLKVTLLQLERSMPFIQIVFTVKDADSRCLDKERKFLWYKVKLYVIDALVSPFEKHRRQWGIAVVVLEDPAMPRLTLVLVPAAETNCEKVKLWSLSIVNGTFGASNVIAATPFYMANIWGKTACLIARRIIRNNLA